MRHGRGHREHHAEAMEHRHLKATGDARKASLDYRLVDPSAPDFAGSKINRAVDNIVRAWRENSHRKGTQLVFCDLSVPALRKMSMGVKASMVSKPSAKSR